MRAWGLGRGASSHPSPRAVQLAQTAMAMHDACAAAPTTASEALTATATMRLTGATGLAMKALDRELITERIMEAISRLFGRSPKEPSEVRVSGCGKAGERSWASRKIA